MKPTHTPSVYEYPPRPSRHATLAANFAVKRIVDKIPGKLAYERGTLDDITRIIAQEMDRMADEVIAACLI